LVISPKVCLQIPVVLTPWLLFSSDAVTSHNVHVATYQHLHYGCPLRDQFTVSRTRKMLSPAYIVYPTSHRDCLLLDYKVQNKILFSLQTYFPLLPLPSPFLVFFFFFYSRPTARVDCDGMAEFHCAPRGSDLVSSLSLSLNPQSKSGCSPSI
jgi:hypothetical protein